MARVRYKCYHKIDELRSNTAVIFVSHNLPDIARICSSAIIIKNGLQIYSGSPNNAIMYFDSFKETKEKSIKKIYNYIKNFEIDANKITNCNKQFIINFNIESIHDINEFIVSIKIKSESGVVVSSAKVFSHEYKIKIKKGLNKFKVILMCMPFITGRYLLNVWIMENNGKIISAWDNALEVDVICSKHKDITNSILLVEDII